MRSPFSALSGPLKQLAQMSFQELTTLFPQLQDLPRQLGEAGRDRLYIPWVVFWLFLHQSFEPACACQQVVIKALGWLALVRHKLEISPNTSAYCKARGRLKEDGLLKILQHTSDGLEAQVQPGHLWHQFRVVVADGTTLSLPDTEENQKEYPQQKSQKPGCGFPLLRLLVFFSLETGAVWKQAVGSFYDSEVALFRFLARWLQPSDLLLYDRGLCDFYDLACLQQRQVSFVVRFKEHITRSVTPYRRLGKKDRLVRWRKPKPPQHVTAAQWEALPAVLLLRQVSYIISGRGLRTRRVTIITSLCDGTEYGAEEFADLYQRRWRVELFLKQIKVTLKMETLRCLSPQMIRKELWMHLIAYNLIRSLIWTAADQKGVPLERIGFKAAVSFIDQWLPLFIFATHSPRQQKKLFNALWRNLARCLVPLRPGRREPRAVKRRPKPFPLLTAPRHRFIEIPHRGKRK